MPGERGSVDETRLFIAKLLWTFDLAGVGGKELSFEKGFIAYGLWVKPELRARFLLRTAERSWKMTEWMYLPQHNFDID